MVGPDGLPQESDKSRSQTNGHPIAGSISVLIDMLRNQADQDAAHNLYHRYFDQLVAKLRGRINRKVQAIADSEDAAQFAMSEVLSKIIQGRYPDLADRQSLWALMVHIGDRRTRQVWRDETAGVRDVQRLQALPTSTQSGNGLVAFDPNCDSIPPEMLVEVEDMVVYLSQRLSKKEYYDILIWELQGYTPSEIKALLEEKLQRRVFESSLRRWRQLMRHELQASYPEDYPNA